MAVLAEAISVIVRHKAIDELYPGGWNAFRDAVPNATLCSDGELARVGFMTPQDVGAYVEALRRHGLRWVIDGTAVDLAVVDQQSGLTTPCDWLAFGRVNLTGLSESIAQCRLVGSELGAVAVPEGWTFDRSLSRQFGFVASAQVEAQTKFLRHENGRDVLLDLATGKEVYVGRTSS